MAESVVVCYVQDPGNNHWEHYNNAKEEKLNSVKNDKLKKSR